MTTPIVPEVQLHPAPASQSASRRWTRWAFLTQVFYVLWLPLMFAFGYLLGSIFGYELGTQESVGFGALLANIVVALVVIPLPSWIGVGLAVQARRLGGRVASAVALVLCALTGMALAIASLPLHGV